MIIGVGLDIQAISKIAASLESPAYLKKVFTPAEIALCQPTPHPADHFAGKFAIKEACMKALGAGIRQGLWFTDIEVLNHASGAPYLTLYQEALRRAADLRVTTMHLSISHSAGVAVGVVILEHIEGAHLATHPPH